MDNTKNYAEQAIDSTKDILTKYYNRDNYEDLFRGLPRRSQLEEILGNLLCDMLLLAEKEKVNWANVESYAKRHFEADKNLIK